MTSNQKSLSDYTALVVSKEIELLALGLDISHFLDAKHKAEDTEAFQMIVRNTEREIDVILQLLLKERDASSDFKNEAANLCQDVRGLKTYIGGIKRDLSDDLFKLHRSEDKKGSVDITRNVGIFFGIVGFFIAAEKSGVGNGIVDVNQAAEVGGVVGILTISHKKLKKAFVMAGNAACRTPQQIKNSFTVFYVRETIKEKTIATKNAFGKGATLISGRILRTVSRARKSVMTRKSNQNREP